MKTSRDKAKSTIHWAKSSAFVSLAVHLIIFAVAGSIVAVKLNIKEDVQFEGHKRARPKMKMKKLQLPVQLQKKQKPKKAQVKTRLTVKNVKMKSSMPELKLSENISGSSLGGSSIAGMGSDQLGGAGSLGFSLSTVDFMGVKSKGEKICFLIDTKRDMLFDSKGGLWAYNIVKSDVVKNINRLGSTTMFNVIAYDHYGKVYKFQPTLTSASKSKKASFEQWLEPINKSKNGDGMKSNYDFSKMHNPLDKDTVTTNWPFKQGGYIKALQAALEMHADVIYIFSSNLESYKTKDKTSSAKNRYDSAIASWEKNYPVNGFKNEADKKRSEIVKNKAKKLLAAYQKSRTDKGLPADQQKVYHHFYSQAGGYPEWKRKPDYPVVTFSQNDMWKATLSMIKENYLINDIKPPIINVIIFAGKDEKPDINMLKIGKTLASKTKGRSRILKGLSASDIQRVMEGKASAEDLKKAAGK